RAARRDTVPPVPRSARGTRSGTGRSVAPCPARISFLAPERRAPRRPSPRATGRAVTAPCSRAASQTPVFLLRGYQGDGKVHGPAADRNGSLIQHGDEASHECGARSHEVIGGSPRVT